MADRQTRWVARLAPMPGSGVEILLKQVCGVDVWERHPDALVVVASDMQLVDLERRRLALVERIRTVEDFLANPGGPAGS